MGAPAVDACPLPDEAPGLAASRWLLVVCSLESWGVVQRRMQLLVREVLSLDPAVHVLFVEPAVDVPFQLLRRRFSTAVPRRQRSTGRLTVLRPLKVVPRVFGMFSDRSLERQVERAARRLVPSGQEASPVLWINNATYADLVTRTGWPTIYDVTDDWLLSSMTPRARARLRSADQLLLERADAVVVCSPDLARSRGARRPVTVIPNAVDLVEFTRPRPRPDDLPPSPVVLYVGSLHEDRLDIDLCVELAASVDAQVVFVGPNSLGPSANRRLQSCQNVRLLGPRPYGSVPAYLQHADVLIVPHVVTPFTESLDPIKAYEYLAVGRPTVATPVAGFRDTAPFIVADRGGFVRAVAEVLAGPQASSRVAADVPTWADRGRAFAKVIGDVRSGRAS